MPLVLWVALGSAVGGAARYGVSVALPWRGEGWPAATLLVNVLGSVVLGLVMGYAASTPAFSESLRLLLTAGFCGGFTTFSTFGLEAAALIQVGDLRRASLYVLASVVVSIAGAALGIGLGRGLSGT